ncbi:hypothetical protein SAMN03159304_01175 [Pseudomonas sp. NFACC24-1]|nr:hypothetical protein SAMN03159304_01175 [Pseudomonas sp. NFACC24-1]
MVGLIDGSIVGSVDDRWMIAGRWHPGFIERLQVRYGAQNEVFLDLLDGCLIVLRACCCTTRSDS